jgi:CubicO group peptidase (beta-lactamase class C family)
VRAEADTSGRCGPACRALVVVAVLAALGCGSAPHFAPLPDDGTFPHAAPAPDALAHYRLAAAYSRARGGVAVVVVDGEHVVFEDDENGNRGDDPHHVFSGTKSFACALAAAAVADGRLDLEERAATTLPEWRADPRKARITVRQLLDFTSGLDQPFRQLMLDGLGRHPHVRDKFAFALGVKAGADPGSTFRYGPAHLMAFGALMKRKLGEDPVRYLDERVLRPIGFRSSWWIIDPAGNAMLPYGAWTTALEWAKYGVLMRDGGVWRGTRVLPAAGVAACLQGSRVMPAYGLTFWLNAPVGPRVNAQAMPAFRAGGPTGFLYPGGPPDLFAAAGLKDNRLYVVPSRGLVIARLGTGSRQWRDAEFLARVLDGRGD